MQRRFACSPACIASGLDRGQGTLIPSPLGLLHNIVILAVRGML